MSNENEGAVLEQTEISDLIQDFVPPAATAEGAEQVANAEQQTTTQEAGNVAEGQERAAEEAGEQKPAEQQQTEGQQTQVAAGQIQAHATEQQTQTQTQQQEQPPQKTELELLKEENAKLLAHLNEIAGRVVAPKQPEKTPEQLEQERKVQEQQAKQVLAFLPNEEVFDEVLKNKDNFNALLTGVVNAAVERSLRLMPQLATQIVDQKITMTNLVKDFYTDNKDLIAHKQYVGFVSNEVAAQHPDWTLPQILTETEKVVRERLKLARVAETAANVQISGSVQGQSGNIRTAGENPGFVPGASGGRRGNTESNGNLSAEAKDILSLIS